jgi:hypothetical protein
LAGVQPRQTQCGASSGLLAAAFSSSSLSADTVVLYDEHFVQFIPQYPSMDPP